MRKRYLFFVYIMSNKSRRLYTGVTNDIHRRAFEHKHKRVRGFTACYCFDMLVYYEEFGHIGEAIAQEKEIKGWSRAKKLALILAQNPLWADLSEGWYPQDEWPLPDVRLAPES